MLWQWANLKEGTHGGLHFIGNIFLYRLRPWFEYCQRIVMYSNILNPTIELHNFHISKWRVNGSDILFLYFKCPPTQYETFQAWLRKGLLNVQAPLNSAQSWEQQRNYSVFPPLCHTSYTRLQNNHKVVFARWKFNYLEWRRNMWASSNISSYNEVM